ncbi:MAG TPA: hypothetical protein VFR28_02425 [Allosphingosinicella sp.]|nr:hypothetical protein [Allosphingosinicella sp.]
MSSIFLAALALAAPAAAPAASPAAAPQWAPVALSPDEPPTLFFIDRASLKATSDGSSAWAFVVPPEGALRLHVEYDCADSRYRFLESALQPGAAPGSPGATPWTPVKPATPLHQAMRYVCSGAKLDLGFGDVAIEADSPEAFTREFVKRRAAAKRK